MQQHGMSSMQATEARLRGQSSIQGCCAPRRATRRVPRRVAKVSMRYLMSPSTSGRSLVMAMTVAKTVTKQVMNLHSQAIALLQNPCGQRQTAARCRNQAR